MAIDLVFQTSFLGASGAFIYAAPRVTACLFADGDGHPSRAACIVEFVFAIMIGAIGAAAFGPWISAWLKMTTPGEFNAICAVIGLVANPTAPLLLNLAPRMASTLLAAFKGPMP